MTLLVYSDPSKMVYSDPPYKPITSLMVHAVPTYIIFIPSLFLEIIFRKLQQWHFKSKYLLHKLQKYSGPLKTVIS